LVIGADEGHLRLGPFPCAIRNTPAIVVGFPSAWLSKLFIRDGEGLDRDGLDAGSSILGGVSAARLAGQ
jgi:hypothetical protein